MLLKQSPRPRLICSYFIREYNSQIGSKNKGKVEWCTEGGKWNGTMWQIPSFWRTVSWKTYKWLLLRTVFPDEKGRRIIELFVGSCLSLERFSPVGVNSPALPECACVVTECVLWGLTPQHQQESYRSGGEIYEWGEVLLVCPIGVASIYIELAATALVKLVQEAKGHREGMRERTWSGKRGDWNSRSGLLVSTFMWRKLKKWLKFHHILFWLNSFFDRDH